jgi:hypothetical protein
LSGKIDHQFKEPMIKSVILNRIIERRAWESPIAQGQRIMSNEWRRLCKLNFSESNYMPTSDRQDAMDTKSENREWRIEDRHAIFDPPLPILNRQSPIANHQSPIASPQTWRSWRLIFSVSSS